MTATCPGQPHAQSALRTGGADSKQGELSHVLLYIHVPPLSAHGIVRICGGGRPYGAGGWRSGRCSSHFRELLSKVGEQLIPGLLRARSRCATMLAKCAQA